MIQTLIFRIFYYNHILFHDYNDLIKLFQIFLVILLCCIKRYNICLISFFKLFELFPAFICANNIGNLVNNLPGVKIFNSFLLLVLHDLLVVAYYLILLHHLIVLLQTIYHYRNLQVLSF